MTFLPEDSNDIPDKINEKFSSDNIQLFHIKRLQFNITKHILSPKYIKLTESEIESLKKDYDLNNIAKIPIYDPICKYYDMKTNDILKLLENLITLINIIHIELLFNNFYIIFIYKCIKNYLFIFYIIIYNLFQIFYINKHKLIL